MDQPIYQTESHNKSPRDAAHEFCRTYWPQPREVESCWSSNNNEFLFQVVEGMRTYKVVTVPAVPLVSLGLYQIYVAKG